MSTDTALPRDAELDLCTLWRELAADPKAPNWFELTEHGELVFVPQPTPKHQLAASRLLGQVHDQLGDAVVPSIAVLTKTDGVRVPDLVWISKDRVEEAVAQDPMQLVPPLVVEVLSESDRWSVLAHKVRAYLETGCEKWRLFSWMARLLTTGPTGCIRSPCSGSGCPTRVTLSRVKSAEQTPAAAAAGRVVM